MALRLTTQRLSPASYLTAATRATSRPIARLNQVFQHTRPRNMSNSTYAANGDNGDLGSTEGELNAWKHRAPYKVHDNAEDFKVRYEGSCHCGRIKYQLSREKPLDSKYCHCTTCQKIHGKHPLSSSPLLQQVCGILIQRSLARRPLPMGRHLPQGRHQLHPRPPRPRLVRELRENLRPQAALQGQLRLLPHPHHGRRPQHDPLVPHPHRFQNARGT